MWPSRNNLNLNHFNLWFLTEHMQIMHVILSIRSFQNRIVAPALLFCVKYHKYLGAIALFMLDQLKLAGYLTI